MAYWLLSESKLFKPHWGKYYFKDPFLAIIMNATEYLSKTDQIIRYISVAQCIVEKLATAISNLIEAYVSYMYKCEWKVSAGGNDMSSWSGKLQVGIKKQKNIHWI